MPDPDLGPPTPPSPAETLARLKAVVLQSAQTSRLFGVDFIPVYRSGVLGVSFAESVTDEVVSDQPLAQAPASPETLIKNSAANARATTPRAAAHPSAASHDALPTSRPTAAKRAKDQQPPLLTVEIPAPPRAEWNATVPAAVAAARTPEQRAESMAALLAKYESDAPHKAFDTPHTTIVWGEGDLNAKIMFIGEAPGEEEDKSGRPFVGRAGALLTKMIAAININRSDVYIANVLKVRPPNNRTPTPAESNISAPYLYEQIAIVGPRVIVTLGLPATRLLLQTQETMGQYRGTWAAITLPDGRVISVMPTYHPSYVLRTYTDEVRAKVWADLKLALTKAQ